MKSNKYGRPGILGIFLLSLFIQGMSLFLSSSKLTGNNRKSLDTTTQLRTLCTDREILFLSGILHIHRHVYVIVSASYSTLRYNKFITLYIWIDYFNSCSFMLHTKLYTALSQGVSSSDDRRKNRSFYTLPFIGYPMTGRISH